MGWRRGRRNCPLDSEYGRGERAHVHRESIHLFAHLLSPKLRPFLNYPKPRGREIEIVYCAYLRRLGVPFLICAIIVIAICTQSRRQREGRRGGGAAWACRKGHRLGDRVYLLCSPETAEAILASLPRFSVEIIRRSCCPTGAPSHAAHPSYISLHTLICVQEPVPIPLPLPSAQRRH